MADDEGNNPELKVGDELEFHYQKSPDYRTIHCDGAYGGVTPKGYLAITLYNERNIVPKKSTREIIEIGAGQMAKLAPEQVRETLGGVMRQLEVTVFIDINATKELWTWIGNKLVEMEEGMGIPEEHRVTGKAGKQE